MSGTQLKARKIIPGSRWSEGKGVGEKRLRLKGGAGRAEASLRASLAGFRGEGRHWAAGRPVGARAESVEEEWAGWPEGQAGGLAGSLIGQMRPDAKCSLGQLRREGGSHSKARENRFLEEDDKLILEPVDRGPCGM